jgi:hypothetical protein
VADEEIYVVSDSAEKAIEDYFDQVATAELSAIRERGKKKIVKSSLDELQESDDEMEVDAGTEMNGHDNDHIGKSKGSEILESTDEASGDASKQASLPLDSSPTQKTPDLNPCLLEDGKVKIKAINDPGSNGSADTGADLAINAGHSNVSELKQDDKIDDLEDSLEPPLVHHDLPFDDATLSHDVSHSNEARDPNGTLDEEVDESYSQMKSSIPQISDAIAETNRKQPTEKSADDITPEEEAAAMKPSPTSKQVTDVLLSKIRKGSRIMVRWGKDGALYKATVKKVQLDSDEPTIKIHYDGKKSHIRDSISSNSIHSIIDQENMLLNSAKTSNDTYSRNDQSHIALKDLLRGKYPNSLPLEKLEHREQCYELGAGWTVYITSKRNQVGQKRLRADRYFISPSGKSFQSIKELENYRLERPEEFDLCPVTEDSNCAVAEEPAALLNNIRKPDANAPSALSRTNADGNETETPEIKATLPQCQDLSANPNPETEISHFGVDSFSPLMMGNPGPAIEDSHSDREFLSSLMDEKGLLFGEEELEEDLSTLPTRDQSRETQSVATDTMQSCTLKPMTSCMKCPSPSPKERECGDAVKKNVHVHFAEEEPDLPQDEALEPDNEVRKKGLSPRMKHNKKALIGGIVPLFAMDVPVDAEFAG